LAPSASKYQNINWEGMKPTKNRVYCRDSGRIKMLFETEKKANTFIKFNSEEMESESGYSPVRSYYCILCNGWHVTSKKNAFKMKSKTEIILEQYRHNKEQQAIERARKDEMRQEQAEALNKHFKNIDKLIELLESKIEGGRMESCLEILNYAFAELEKAKNLLGSKTRKKNAEATLIFLKKEIERWIASKQKKRS
jgi:hypothetical protein